MGTRPTWGTFVVFALVGPIIGIFAFSLIAMIVSGGRAGPLGFGGLTILVAYLFGLIPAAVSALLWFASIHMVQNTFARFAAISATGGVASSAFPMLFPDGGFFGGMPTDLAVMIGAAGAVTALVCSLLSGIGREQ